MRLTIPIRMRFLISVTLLLVILVVSILVVIEKRMVGQLYEEEISKAIFMARYIIQKNMPDFIWGDRENVEATIQKQIDLKLVYVVMFDEKGEHFASTRFIKDYPDIFQKSDLQGDVTEGSYIALPRALKDKTTGQVLNILEVEVPIFSEGSSSQWGTVKVGVSTAELPISSQAARILLLRLGFGGLLLGILGAVLLARNITNPIKKLVAGTERISKGDFSHNIVIHSQDEIGGLARSFNQMSQRLRQARKRMEEANKKLIQAEKLASIGRMSAGIAHEIRNPLTSVKLNIQKVMISEEMEDLDKDHLEIAREGIGQIEVFIREMLNYTRTTDLNLDYFSMAQIVDESIKVIADSLELRNIRTDKTFEKGLPLVKVDADKLRQVFVNLFRNAYEAVDEGGNIWISVEGDGGGARKSDHMIIQISDDGPGIPEKDWDTIFEPYYTTKSSGFGFGLANSRKIIEQHGGTIKVTKSKYKGITFEIMIPLEGEQ
jgi:signal transduction histidine kinase